MGVEIAELLDNDVEIAVLCLELLHHFRQFLFFFLHHRRIKTVLQKPIRAEIYYQETLVFLSFICCNATKPNSIVKMQTGKGTLFMLRQIV